MLNAANSTGFANLGVAAAFGDGPGKDLLSDCCPVGNTVVSHLFFSGDDGCN